MRGVGCVSASLVGALMPDRVGFANFAGPKPAREIWHGPRLASCLIISQLSISVSWQNTCLAPCGIISGCSGYMYIFC